MQEGRDKGNESETSPCRNLPGEKKCVILLSSCIIIAENDMGIILSLSGLCLRTKTQGRREFRLRTWKIAQQKRKTTDMGLILKLIDIF